MRFRDEDNTNLIQEIGQGYIKDRYGNVTNPTYNYPLGGSREGSYRAIYDVVIPNFKERSARGEVFVNPMFKYSSVASVTPGGWTVTHNTTPQNTVETWSNDYSPISVRGGLAGHLQSSINTDKLVTLAGTEASANIHSPEVQGLVSIGELRETLSFLRNPAKAWLEFAKRSKRLKNRGNRFEKAQSVGQFIGDNWLGYRYGVRPMVADAQNVMSALQAWREKPPERFTARGYAETSDTTNDTSVIGNWLYETSTDTSLSVRAGVLYELTTDYDHFGLNVEQIPMAVWELIPFSFVADWFANIGSYVGAITPKSGVKVLGSWTTTKLDQNTTASGRLSTHATGSVSGVSPTVERFTSKSTRRNPGISVGLSFETAPYTGDIGQKRIADTFALAQNILRSR